MGILWDASWYRMRCGQVCRAHMVIWLWTRFIGANMVMAGSGRHEIAAPWWLPVLLGAAMCAGSTHVFRSLRYAEHVNRSDNRIRRLLRQPAMSLEGRARDLRRGAVIGFLFGMFVIGVGVAIALGVLDNHR